MGKVKSNSEYANLHEAITKLKLSKKVRWKIYLGYLCRYTKKDICPEFVIENGLPVKIKNILNT